MPNSSLPCVRQRPRYLTHTGVLRLYEVAFDSHKNSFNSKLRTTEFILKLLLYVTCAHGLRTPRESFFQKIETYGLGQTDPAGIL